MKILYFCWEFPPVGSGIGVYIREMSQALMNAGHEVIVVTSMRADLPERERFGLNGSIFRIYDYGQVGSRAVADKVLEIANSHQVDCVEVADHLGEGSSLIQVRERPPVIVKCHYNDVVPCVRYGQARWWWQRLLIDAACLRDYQRLRRERQSIAKADGLLCITRKMLQEIGTARLATPEKSAIIPNPIAGLPQWTNNEAANPIMLFVGRVDFGKGVDFLPEILCFMVKRFPNVRLEIAGGDGYARGVGSIRKWLVKRFDKLADHVLFLGHISHRQLDEAYRRAWVVLVPSRWDTFPMSVLESMIRGKAIVASPHGGIPEMLENTVNKIAEPSAKEFGEAVADLLGSQVERERAGKSGLDKALTIYNPGRIAKQYVDTLQGWL